MRCIILILLVAVLAFADSPRYIFVGTYELGDVLSALCQDTGCKLGISGDVVKLPITLSVSTSKASALLSAVRNSLLSSGYYLTGTPKGFVSVTNDASREMFYFVDCRNSVQIVPKEHRDVYLRADSLQCLEKPPEPPLATAKYTLQYFAFDNSVLDNWGIDWTKVLSSGDFFSKPQIPLSWSIRALGENDSLVQFRSLQFSLDSALRIVWGNETQESLKSYAENGVVTTSYEWRDYGLTIDLKRTKEKISRLQLCLERQRPQQVKRSQLRQPWRYFAGSWRLSGLGQEKFSTCLSSVVYRLSVSCSRTEKKRPYTGFSFFG